MIKSRFLKDRPTKIKYKLSKHAKQRLKERFNLDSIGKIYENQIECLNGYSCNLRSYFLRDRDMVFIRNKNSKTIVTVLTPEMWNKNEYKRMWEESLREE